MSEPVKILFVCSQNRWRSLTAEKMFHGVSGFAVKSAGTEAGARIKINEGHVGWADIIFAMEKKHVQRIQSKFPEALAGKRLICLQIPDDYAFMEGQLIELLKERVGEHIEMD